MRDLETALDSHMRLAFPRDAANEELSIIHAELAEFDGFVVGLVEKVLRGKTSAARDLYYDEEMANRLDRIISSGAESEIALAQSYKGYLQSLKVLADTAQAFHKNRTDRREPDTL